jgi:hypothetical protein
MRSVLVTGGRFTSRLRTMRGFRNRTFSAMSSDLLLPRSVRVESGKEVLSGFVHPAKREESASKQGRKIILSLEVHVFERMTQVASTGS